jgi:diguanylate cyclase (GGDEF)-like protein
MDLPRAVFIFEPAFIFIFVFGARLLKPGLGAVKIRLLIMKKTEFKKTGEGEAKSRRFRLFEPGWGVGSVERKRFAFALRLLGAILLLASSLVAEHFELPARGDLGVFAIAAGLSVFLLREQPFAALIPLIPAVLLSGYSLFVKAEGPVAFLFLEPLFIAAAAWYAAWRAKVDRAESLRSLNALEERVNELKKISLRDPLTGLFNRRYAFEAGPAAVSQCRRYGGELHLIMLDIDHFKRVNDKLGHAVGDTVLKGLSDLLLLILRQSDILARIGGEEFVVILPRTDVEAAYNIANRIRDGVREHGFVEVPWKVTVSLGVVTLHPEESFEAALERADFCLYQSKRSGRNRVTVG